ncbi:2,3-bisphosphoglycerate-independent phosphoglycerate mutase [Candidatus Parcubacteria bacterium]|nr:MAG: 2,3-bisphosphoglycerate-independent phosphoglycerate mutase [Candidatus Parcubacteria bacterium]
MQKLCLIILDGFGIGEQNHTNPVFVARTPTIDELERYYPKTALQASGFAVGLPWGEPGNSEVGHLTIGAGFIPYQALPRINKAIQDESFFSNKILLSAAEHVKNNNSQMHIMGLLTSGSVHAYLDHIFALVEFAKRTNIPKIFFHLFTDGRDSLPRAAVNLLQNVIRRTQDSPAVLGTIIGRFFSMDRDGRWERTQKAYECLVEGKCERFDNATSYLEASYNKGLNDEFIEPAGTALEDFKIKDNDAVVFFNFREDSARQLTEAFTLEKFDGFSRSKLPKNLYFATFTEYEKGLSAKTIFEPILIDWPLSRVISQVRIKQVHIAETEKYAHITYFLNGLKEQAFDGEERTLVPSVSADRFDDKPEMSAFEIKQKILEVFSSSKYGFLAVNFANADMVGHTGNFSSAVKAVETIDRCLSEIIQAAARLDWTIVITSDHGNVEKKIHPVTGEMLTEHTDNPVPFYIVGPKFRKPEATNQMLTNTKSEGLLSDVAPTILDLMEIAKPPSMTSEGLLRQIL